MTCPPYKNEMKNSFLTATVFRCLCELSLLLCRLPEREAENQINGSAEKAQKETMSLFRLLHHQDKFKSELIWKPNFSPNVYLKNPKPAHWLPLALITACIEDGEDMW